MNNQATRWPEGWPDSRALCPCDYDFVDYLDKDLAIYDKRIFHMGTGLHHKVGIWAANHGARCLGITISPEEHETYVNLLSEEPFLSDSYSVWFTDLYVLNDVFVPKVFDYVSLFHLNERYNYEFSENDVQKVLWFMTSRLRSNGKLLLYKGSSAYDRVEPMIEELKANYPGVVDFEEFKSLKVLQILF